MEIWRGISGECCNVVLGRGSVVRAGDRAGVRVMRLVCSQNVLCALGAALGVLLVVGLTQLQAGEEYFFLTALMLNSLAVFLCFVSLLASRPLVASTSFMPGAGRENSSGTHAYNQPI